MNAKEDGQLSINPLSQFNLNPNLGPNISGDFSISPTVFDALKKSKGITNYADLSNVKIIRQNSKSSGGGKIETSLNILEMILNGDQSQNINLQDDDTIIIPRSKIS